MNTDTIIHQQIGVTTMTPRVDETLRGRAESIRNAAAYAKLEPCDDATAGALTLPPLGLLDEDVETIHSFADAYRAAHMAAIEAEQTLAGARRVAGQLQEHRRNAGEIAARAYSGRLNGHGKAETEAITARIETSRNAEAAIPSLEREAEAAEHAAGRARGALARAVKTALHGAMVRASERFSQHVLDLTRCLASIEAMAAAMPSKDGETMQAGLSVFRHRLWVPALPTTELGVPADRASIDCKFVSTVLSADHDRMMKHNVAAAGWLHQQLQQALGNVISARSLLG